MVVEVFLAADEVKAELLGLCCDVENMMTNKIRGKSEGGGGGVGVKHSDDGD